MELYGGFPKIRGTFLGVPIIRIVIYWGSMLGSPYLGKLPYQVPGTQGNGIDNYAGF